MIQVHVDVKTTDNYQLRIFVVAFTKKQKNQQKKTTYAQSQQTKLIRQRMVETINQEVQNGDIRALVTKLLPDSIAKDIEKKVSPIYPVHDCYVSKVKVIKKPKLDISRLWSFTVKLVSKPMLKVR